MSTLIGEPPERGAHVLAHEGGHHLFKHLGKDAREFWDTAIRQDYGPIDLQSLLDAWPDTKTWARDFVDSMATSDPVLALQVDVVSFGHGGIRDMSKRSDFEALLAKGETKLIVPQTPITGYAGKNPEESFCEAIGRLVGYGPRTVDPLVQHWLDIIIPGMVKTASINPFSPRNSMDATAKVVQRYIEAKDQPPSSLSALVKRTLGSRYTYKYYPSAAEEPHLFTFKAINFSVNMTDLKTLLRNGLTRIQGNDTSEMSAYFGPTGGESTGPDLSKYDFENMGKEAYMAGVSRSPGLDQAFTDVVKEGRPIGDPDSTKAMKDWLRGWDKANLARPDID